MLNHIQPETLICIDIETVPVVSDFRLMDDAMKEMFLAKAIRLRKEGEDDAQHFFNAAGIYAEFGKVVCICVGLFIKPKTKSDGWKLRIKSFAGDDEKIILQEFSEMLNKLNKKTNWSFAGHNIREFDIPYLCRRMLINNLELPAIMDVSGKKPYEIHWVDTMQLWRFGDVKHYTSVKLLATLLGITSPKDDIDGKDVGRVYWKEKNLKRIVTYCRKDVVTVAQLVLRFKGIELLSQHNISSAD